MKQTAIQQAIIMVRSKIESIDETLMGKHTIHHLQQIERGLYELLEIEKEQISIAIIEGAMKMHHKEYISGEQYYNWRQMKQTAVEWYFTELWNAPKDKFIWHTILIKANAMFNEQIKDAHLNGQSEWDIKGLADINKKLAEQYYNEIYGDK